MPVAAPVSTTRLSACVQLPSVRMWSVSFSVSGALEIYREINPASGHGLLKIRHAMRGRA